MQLEGTHTLDAPAQQIWTMLLDPMILAKITPSVKSLELQSEGVYKAISEVKLGPVNGSFSGTMELAEVIAPKSFVLKMKQNSKIGNVNAEGKIELNPLSPTKTEIIFAGEAKLSGTLSRTGQRVLSGVANALTQEFFRNLENELRLSQGLEVKKEGFFQWIKRWLRAIFRGGSKKK
jgi:carbon monoxide dehydrogenase subunit G